MTEPTTSPTPLDPATMTAEQAAAEFATARDNPALYDVAHPEHGALNARMNALTARVRGESTPAPLSPSTESPNPGAPAAPPSPEDIAARIAAFPDPHAAPQTAAELDAVPLPAGLDPALSRAANAAAERAGVTAMVLEGRHVIARARSAEVVDFATLEQRLEARYGRALPSKLDAFFTALDDPDFPPALRADLERRGLDLNDEVFDYLARMGEALTDASTPGGERRLKAKYQQWEASQPR